MCAALWLWTTFARMQVLDTRGARFAGALGLSANQRTLLNYYGGQEQAPEADAAGAEARLSGSDTRVERND